MLSLDPTGLPPPPRSSDVRGTVVVEKHGCDWQPMLRVTVAVDTAAEVEGAGSEEAEADATLMKLVVVYRCCCCLETLGEMLGVVSGSFVIG